jgi:hypothetical protein
MAALEMKSCEPCIILLEIEKPLPNRTKLRQLKVEPMLIKSMMLIFEPARWKDRIETVLPVCM